MRYEVDVSGGEHGRKDGDDGRCAFSCWTDYGGLLQPVDDPFPPEHPLANSDQIPIHPLHLGEYPRSPVLRISSHDVFVQSRATRPLPREGVSEAVADVDVDEEIRQHCRHCGSQLCLECRLRHAVGRALSVHR